jgi:hypothetical protein
MLSYSWAARQFLWLLLAERGLTAMPMGSTGVGRALRNERPAAGAWLRVGGGELITLGRWPDGSERKWAVPRTSPA